MDLGQLEAILKPGLSNSRQLQPSQDDLLAVFDGDEDEATSVRFTPNDGQLQPAIRSEKITVRVTSAQKRSLLQWCRGMDLSTYIRLFLFDLRTNQSQARLIPTVNRQTYLELMQVNEVIQQQSAMISQQLGNSRQPNGQPDENDFDNNLTLHLQQLQQLEVLIREIRLTLAAPIGATNQQP